MGQQSLYERVAIESILRQDPILSDYIQSKQISEEDLASLYSASLSYNGKRTLVKISKAITRQFLIFSKEKLQASIPKLEPLLQLLHPENIQLTLKPEELYTIINKPANKTQKQHSLLYVVCSSMFQDLLSQNFDSIIDSIHNQVVINSDLDKSVPEKGGADNSEFDYLNRDNMDILSTLNEVEKNVENVQKTFEKHLPLTLKRQASSGDNVAAADEVPKKIVRINDDNVNNDDDDDDNDNDNEEFTEMMCNDVNDDLNNGGGGDDNDNDNDGDDDLSNDDNANDNFTDYQSKLDKIARSEFGDDSSTISFHLSELSNSTFDQSSTMQKAEVAAAETSARVALDLDEDNIEDEERATLQHRKKNFHIDYEKDVTLESNYKSIASLPSCDVDSADMNEMFSTDDLLRIRPMSLHEKEVTSRNTTTVNLNM